MNQALPTIIDVATEAEFQLSAAKDQLDWLAAIARAIVRDVEHAGGQDVMTLAQLAKYLDETGIASVEMAIDQFKGIASGRSAPQKATLSTCGAGGATC